MALAVLAAKAASTVAEWLFHTRKGGNDLPPRNPRLYHAARSYSEAALGFLARNCQPADRVDFGRDRWVRTGANVFVRQTVPPGWYTRRYAVALESLPEYNALLDQIQQDEVIRRQLNTLAGSPMMSRRIEVENLIGALVGGVVARVEELRFDGGVFDQVYDSIEQAFYEAFIDYKTIVPIENMEVETLPLQVSQDVVIDKLTDEELAACIEAGVLGSRRGPTPFVFLNGETGIRITYRLPKIIGDQTDGQKQDFSNRTARNEAIAQKLPFSLQLFKSGEIRAAGHVTYSDNWLVAGGFAWRTLQPLDPAWMPASKYMLSTQEGHGFLELWRLLQSEGVSLDKALENALRRFGYAVERRRPEDRLIDLVISAESLFLTGEPELRGEQQFRIALRAAVFIEMPGKTSRQVYDVIRFAYRTRNTIVHGGSVDAVRLPGVPPMDLGTFATLVAEHMRLAVKKYVRVAERRETVDWDRLLFD